MYAKMKELGPIGGGVHPARPLDPPMQTEQLQYAFANPGTGLPPRTPVKEVHKSGGGIYIQKYPPSSQQQPDPPNNNQT